MAPEQIHLIRLGVVSFLNARPLIAGLAEDPRVEMRFDVPARLPDLLDSGQVEAALLPVIDVLRGQGRYTVLSDACIASEGETLTVRVFSRVPPQRVETLWVDADSHTSVALAQVLWRQRYGRELTLQTSRGPTGPLTRCEAVLLIGDKVVHPRRGAFPFELDLGAAWRELTGLPFVFAVWAGRSGAHPAAGADGLPVQDSFAARDRHLATLLAAARDRGVERAGEIAESAGPAHGWPVALARRYLTRCLSFHLDERARAGVERFAALCAAADLVPAAATLAPQVTRLPAEVTR